MPLLPPTNTLPSAPVDAPTGVKPRVRPPVEPPPEHLVTLERRTPGTHIEISQAGREALTRSEIAARTLGAVEEELGLPKERLDETGREEFLESIRTPKDVSDESTADRIHEGILTYLFEAFQLEHPNPGRQRLEEFASSSARGLSRGLRDAANLLIAIGVRQSELADQRAMTFDEVQRRVEEFAEAKLAEGQRPPTDEATPPELDLLGDGEPPS